MDQPAARRVSPGLAFVAGLLVAAGLIFGFMAWRAAREGSLRSLPVEVNLPRPNLPIPPRLPDTPTLPAPPIPTPR